MPPFFLFNSAVAVLNNHIAAQASFLKSIFFKLNKMFVSLQTEELFFFYLTWCKKASKTGEKGMQSSVKEAQAQLFFFLQNALCSPKFADILVC